MNQSHNYKVSLCFYIRHGLCNTGITTRSGNAIHLIIVDLVAWIRKVHFMVFQPITQKLGKDVSEVETKISLSLIVNINCLTQKSS